jgi:hypothetical protein
VSETIYNITTVWLELYYKTTQQMPFGYCSQCLRPRHRFAHNTITEECKPYIFCRSCKEHFEISVTGWVLHFQRHCDIIDRASATKYCQCIPDFIVNQELRRGFGDIKDIKDILVTDSWASNT